MADCRELINGKIKRSQPAAASTVIVPTLCVGMPQWTLCVRCWDAERPGLHSHAERGNDQSAG
ncbi:hypothetical protein FGA82_12550 [Pseudomonas fluorescens]|nr:hypothetical protein FGA82_12550 [Pseudomonas fluorescens]